MRFLVLTISVILSLSDVFAKNQTKIDTKPVKLIEENKQTELEDFFEKKKQSIDVKNVALQLAVEQNRVKIARTLIDNGENINVRNENGITPLMKTALTVASAREYLDVVKLLIEKGADVNATDSCGYTALMKACRYGHIDIAKFLIENGADTEVENKLTRTVLLQAAIEGRFDIVKFLIKSGANILFAKDRQLQNIFVMDRKTKQTVVGCLIKHAFTKFKDFVKQKLEKF